MNQTDFEGKRAKLNLSSRLRDLGYKAPMQWVIRMIVAIIFGANLGALTALWFGGMISGGPRIGNAIDVDNWKSDWSIGSENANPYVRARVARNGLMGLRKEEAVYFLKTEDDDGETLTEACTYRVSGGTYPAQWWSITLYDSENRLPMNEDGRLSYDRTQAERGTNGQTQSWAFQVSAKAPDTDEIPWVSSKSGGNFDLTLRLYQPSDALLEDPGGTLVPPRIERLFCGSESS
ncbi:MAG: DUF1214 domain-containing protein [Pseudomonadota bacterium]